MKTVAEMDHNEHEVIITSKEGVLSSIKSFYSSLYEKKLDISSEECNVLLDQLQLPNISDEQNTALRKPLTLMELEEAIKNSNNGKSPGNDGLTREFYIVFWRYFTMLARQPSGRKGKGLFINVSKTGNH